MFVAGGLRAWRALLDLNGSLGRNNESRIQIPFCLPPNISHIIGFPVGGLTPTRATVQVETNPAALQGEDR